jgi:hypothetical protein
MERIRRIAAVEDDLVPRERSAAGDGKETPHILRWHFREELPLHRSVKSLTLLVSLV